VERETVDLDDEALLAPEEIDDVGSHRNIDPFGLGQAGAPD
jgi:hypothetical protein